MNVGRFKTWLFSFQDGHWYAELADWFYQKSAELPFPTRTSKDAIELYLYKTNAPQWVWQRFEEAWEEYELIKG